MTKVLVAGSASPISLPLAFHEMRRWQNPISGATPVPHLSEWRRLSRSLFSESVDGFAFDLSVPR